jgi:hypothetical protein
MRVRAVRKILICYALRAKMGTRIMRIKRIKTDFEWPCGHFFLMFYGFNPAFGGDVDQIDYLLK